MNDVEQTMHNTTFVPSPQGRSVLGKIKRVAQDEVSSFQPRLRVAHILLMLLPLQLGGYLRASVFKMAGFRIGEATAMYGRPIITGNGDIYTRLTIGQQCHIGIDCTLDLEEHITIGNRVTIGHQAMILTSSHEIGTHMCRAGAVVRTPVTIKDGAWIGPRCIILPGVTVGEGAVVAVGALVNKSVPPNTRVAGAPARVIEDYCESLSVT